MLAFFLETNWLQKQPEYDYRNFSKKNKKFSISSNSLKKRKIFYPLPVIIL